MAARNSQELFSALSHFPRLWNASEARGVAVFLDYDGTLTPIVERPELALLAPLTKEVLQALACRATVAVISGRDLADVQKLVGLEEIFYAGSHGFDIAGPGGLRIEFEEAKGYLPCLDEAERELRDRLAGIAGSQVERKKYAVACHFRRVAPDEVAEVEGLCEKVAGRYPRLRKTGGKMVFELRPAIDWHKGKAVTLLLRVLEIDRPSVLPLYIGDDLTDEDAFSELERRGLGILVRDEEARPTAARLALNDTDEVRRFLETLAVIL